MRYPPAGTRAHHCGGGQGGYRVGCLAIGRKSCLILHTSSGSFREARLSGITLSEFEEPPLIMHSTRPRAFSRKMRPRSGKYSCSENQIGFRENRFRFSQNFVLRHPLCRIAVMRICQASLQSKRFEFFAIPHQHDNTLAKRLHVCVEPNLDRGPNRSKCLPLDKRILST